LLTAHESTVETSRGRPKKIRLVARGALVSEERFAFIRVIRDQVFDFNGRELSPEGDGKPVIKEALRQMIVYGFDARDRMHRLYQRGGDSALQSELDQLKSPGLADMYRKFLASHQAPQDTVRPKGKHQ